jgi:hypothetical protein
MADENERLREQSRENVRKWQRDQPKLKELFAQTKSLHDALSPLSENLLKSGTLEGTTIASVLELISLQ